MPIHLPAFSRRDFLKRSLAAGAAVALAPELLAARKPVDANTWALFSDTHLAADRSLQARDVNMTDHFQAVARELLARTTRPAALFITGDLAFNSGETGDYGVVTDLLVPIREQGVPVHLMLGNHDNRQRFWDAFQQEKKARRPLADHQAALLRTPRLNWFMLDSLEKTLSTPGLLGPAQLDWLARALDKNPGKPAIVLVHHNPGVDRDINGLKDTAAFFDIIRPRRQVKAYIYGHTHDWKIETDSSGLHLVNLPPVAYVFKKGKPSGWVQGTAHGEGMSLELRCIDTTHPEHGKVTDLKWRT
jgi:3',5'-cyclic-AMP phosphodiesterase